MSDDEVPKGKGVSKRWTPEAVRERQREIVRRNPDDFWPWTNPLDGCEEPAADELARLRRQLDTARELLKLAMACEPEDKEMWEPDAKAFLDGEDKT